MGNEKLSYSQPPASETKPTTIKQNRNLHLITRSIFQNWLRESPIKPQEWHRFPNNEPNDSQTCLLFLDAQIDISDFKRSHWNRFASKQQSILISFCVIHDSEPFLIFGKKLLKLRLFTLIIKKNYKSSIHIQHTNNQHTQDNIYLLIDQISLTHITC